MSSPRTAARWYAAYVVACAAALVWPVYAWVDAATDARPLGLPFAFAWNLLWVLASFLALFLYDRAVHGGGE